MLNQIKKFKKGVYICKLPNGFIRKDIICCPNCNSRLEMTNRDFIDGFYEVCSCTYYCPRCQKDVAEWSYGTFEEESLYTKLPKKKVKKIIEQLVRRAENEEV